METPFSSLVKGLFCAATNSRHDNKSSCSPSEYSQFKQEMLDSGRKTESKHDALYQDALSRGSTEEAEYYKKKRDWWSENNDNLRKKW